MILKSLRLENIRSYKQHEVAFPLGTTLFEGDIGSGKTTLLMAVEFALFGLGSEKAGGLLRAGESKGTVSLCFEVDGREYEVQRTLIKKGRSIQQDAGSVRSKDGTLHLSPSELKQKVLEILNFNEPPDPKAQSNIYRYAVFTPQEEMKAILFMRSDARLQTLRKAFRIEDYRVARDNIQNLAGSIDRRTNSLRAMASDLGKKKEELERKNAELKRDEGELKRLVSAEDDARSALDGLVKHEDGLKSERDKLSKVEGEIPEIDKQVNSKAGDIRKCQEASKKAQNEIDKIRPTLDKLLQISKPTEKSVDALKAERKRLKDDWNALTEKQGAIKSKIQDYEYVQREGVCPTCDREADPSEFENKADNKRQEQKIVGGACKECDDKITGVDQMIDKLQAYLSAQDSIETYCGQIKGQEEIIETNIDKERGLNAEIDELRSRLEQAKTEFKTLNELSDKLRKLDQAIKTATGAWNDAGKKAEAKRTKINADKVIVEGLGNEVKEKEDNSKKADFLSEYEIWLSGYLIPTIENIERHVLVTINQEFGQLFQRWFSLLVEDPTKDARIDEEFTPIVEQDGYEQEIYYLSGGEKTSVALAYRLALNMMVCKVSTAMKSNLLILDEPTDGFSKEQLSRVQDILKEVNCPQIIIVSHEKELESFADQVFKISKTDGVSRVGV
jgi:exonuclease SbcC